MSRTPTYMTDWNDFRHKDEWADYRVDTPAGGDPLQDLEDDGLAPYESVKEVDCPRHNPDYGFKDHVLVWDGRPPRYCGKLPIAVLSPKKKFRRWFTPKKALEGQKIVFYDHDQSDEYHYPDPNCDCVPCSCRCTFCVSQREARS